jgi:formylglycine-generating enzyme required for sulfatase activity
MIISSFDEMPLIFIPEGFFLMGSTIDDPSAGEDEMPQRLVFLSGFWIDQYEVTNRMYGECVEKGICDPPSELVSLNRNSYFDNLSFGEHPVINVDWNQAKAYCCRLTLSSWYPR